MTGEDKHLVPLGKALKGPHSLVCMAAVEVGQAVIGPPAAR